MKMSLHLIEQWQDPRFLDMFANKSKDVVYKTESAVDEFWHPDIFVASADKKAKDWITPPRMEVNSTAYVTYTVMLHLELNCLKPVKGQQYITSLLRLESSAHRMSEIQLKWSDMPVDVSQFVLLPQYTVQDIKVENCTSNSTSDPSPCIQALFELKHDSVASAFHGGIYVISSFLLFISWLGFWIQPSEIRIFLGLGVSLILAILYLTVAEWAENSYMHFTNTALLWLAFCICLTLTMVFEYALVYMCFDLICPKLKAVRTGVRTTKGAEEARSRRGDIADIVCGLIIFPLTFILAIIGFAVADLPSGI